LKGTTFIIRNVEYFPAISSRVAMSQGTDGNNEPSFRMKKKDDKKPCDPVQSKDWGGAGV
jgi:hypothetical protein